jgi:hypothetical protein
MKCSECTIPLEGHSVLHRIICRQKAEIAALKASLEIATAALKSYVPFLMLKGGCSHDDPSWCDESCGDYGKRARQALAKIAALKTRPEGEVK